MPKKKEELSIEERLKKAVVPKEEEPYKIPDNWAWTIMNRIVDVRDGTHDSPVFYSEGYPLITSKNLKKNQINFEDVKFISKEDMDKINQRSRVEKGDILYAMIGTIGNPIYCNFDSLDKFAVKNVAIFKPFNREISKFLKYYLESENYKKLIENKIKGTTQKFIPLNILRNIYLPLPSLEEQKRIVEKLDSLFDKTQKIKDIIEEVKEKTTLRREAILSKAFTGGLTKKWRSKNQTGNARELLVKINEEKLKLWEKECKKAEEERRKKPASPKLKSIDEMLAGEEEIPYKVPNNWVWTKVGDITNYGEVKQVKAESITDDSWILELEDIEKETFEVRNKVLKKDRPNKSNKHIFFKGDILYSKLRPYLNKIVIAEDNGYATTEIIPFKGLIDINNKYIFYYFSFSKTLEIINFLTHGMQMPRLGTDKARNLLFSLPPLEEQKEIVRILDKVFEEENRISELISLEEKIEILEKTILDKAFRGELGTGNVEDEPAIELLKKVLEDK
ncbi:restriction endonuclease subunit S [Fusobacterium varium]|uniref:restriction endonuclease subunit S n=1 Tax=Fusobacterium varium TaxID=856 RepID=UPI0035652CF9